MSQRNKVCDNLPAEGPAEGKGRKASRVETALACSRTGPVFLSLTPHHWASPAVPCLIGLCPATLTRQKYLVTHVHGAIFKMGNQQRPAVQHKELCSGLRGSLEGRGFGGEGPRTRRAESLHCSPETITALLTGYECVHVCVCAQSCPTLCDLMDCGPPGSYVYGIFQARILEWVAIFFSRGSSRPRDQTHISCISRIGRQILYH